MKMAAKSTTLEAAEKDLKELMADVARAIEKAQQAVARITGKGTTAVAAPEPMTPVH
jgi:hypothetical protein